MQKLLIFLSLILSFSAFSQDWATDQELSQADLEAIELEAQDEGEIADISDYEYVEERLEEERAQYADAQDQEVVEDSIQTRQAKQIEIQEDRNTRPETQEEITKHQEDSNEAVGGSAPLYNE